MPKVSLFQGSLFLLWGREMWRVAEKPAATPDRLSWIRAGDGALQKLFANLHDLPWTLPKTIPFFSSVHGARGNPAPFLLSSGHQAVFLHLERRCLQGEVWGGEEGWEEMHERMETSLLHWCNPICCGGKLNEGFPSGKAANSKLGRAGFQHLLSHKLAAWPCTSHSRPTCIMVLTYLAPGRKSSTPSWLAAED